VPASVNQIKNKKNKKPWTSPASPSTGPPSPSTPSDLAPLGYDAVGSTALATATRSGHQESRQEEGAGSTAGEEVAAGSAAREEVVAGSTVGKEVLAGSAVGEGERGGAPPWCKRGGAPWGRPRCSCQLCCAAGAYAREVTPPVRGRLRRLREGGDA
jgi:hypothetical protein